jgi:hypothetical protein
VVDYLQNTGIDEGLRRAVSAALEDREGGGAAGEGLLGGGGEDGKKSPEGALRGTLRDRRKKLGRRALYAGVRTAVLLGLAGLGGWREFRGGRSGGARGGSADEDGEGSATATPGDADGGVAGAGAEVVARDGQPAGV